MAGMSERTADRLRKSVRTTEQLRGGSTPGGQNGAGTVGMVLIKLKEELAQESTPVEGRLWYVENNTWQEGAEPLEIWGWKLNGKKWASGKEGWCTWWSGRLFWWGPEDCGEDI